MKSLPIPSSEYQHVKVFVIIDGCSTGKNLAPLLRGYGYSVVHVLSLRAQSIGYQPKETDYIACYKENENFDFLVQELSAFQIRAIIPGAEAGIGLADRLNEKFQLPIRNDFGKSEARRNKYLMQEVIRQEGIRSVKQILVSDIKPLMEWVEKNGLPIVIKPLFSSGTDGVHFCYSAEDVHSAYFKLMENKTIYHESNLQIVAQEMLKGEEYMINTVSYGEDIYFTDIIYVNKVTVEGSPLYDYAINLSRSDKRFKIIADYVKQVLPAIGLRYGAAHTEVMVTKDGPVLIEVNARLMGTYDMSSISDALGLNQVSELVNIYINDKYLQKKQEMKPVNEKYTLASFLMTEKGGKIVGIPELNMFKIIPGCHSVKFLYKKDDYLPPTSQSPVVFLPGIVNFVADNPEKLLQAHKILRDREKIFFGKIFSPEIQSKNTQRLFLEAGEPRVKPSSLPENKHGATKHNTPGSPQARARL